MAKRNIAALEAHVGYWLRYVSNHVSHAFQSKLAVQGVTVAEWVVLRELLKFESVHPSQLSEQLGMTRGAISKLLERLATKQLVKRLASADDRRYQSIALTPAGRKMVPLLARLADENDREFFGHLPTEQQTQLVALMQEIVRRHDWKVIPVS